MVKNSNETFKNSNGNYYQNFSLFLNKFIEFKYKYIIQGQETTANAIAFSIFEICQNQNVLEK